MLNKKTTFSAPGRQMTAVCTVPASIVFPEETFTNNFRFRFAIGKRSANTVGTEKSRNISVLFPPLIYTTTGFILF